MSSSPIRVFLTPAGALLATLVVAVLVLTIAAGQSPALALGLLAALALARPFTRRALTSLRVGLGRTLPAYAGQEVGFELRLTGVPAGLELRRHTGGQRIFVGGDGVVLLKVAAPRRGLVPLGGLIARTTAPLGLWRAEVVLAPGWQAWAYPRPLGTAPQSQRGQEDPDDLELEPWRRERGGRPHWPSLARGRAQVLRWRGAAVRWLDWDGTSGSTEVRLQSLCAAVLRASAQHERWGLRLPGQALGPDAGRAHSQRCLRALALFRN